MAGNGDLAWGLERARAADPRGFHALFRILGPSVVGYLRARKVDDPDGLANDVFVRAFRKIDTFDGEAEQFRSWVFTIAHNAAIDNARARRRKPAATTLDNVPEPATTPDPVAEAAEAGFGNDHVEELLALLSPDQRDVLLLRVVGDLSVTETAAIVGKAEEAVKALQRRGRASLRRHISSSGAVPR
jgi:RNA polymerase sigma-70 factor (ECF subfamily)